ncbi:MFS transporter [Paenibacillus glycanilyticus]|uniref:MFS transporter n=1 Tax=Paenibacillus glycanilyticus TaxID=126569 RepID=A0ABQ6GCH8_9BACL|nr:MFS transporter [Paenibacillus glycanilyticus]GLX67970.1 MFS transporter [Paenibacillus glycanilyticus]
MKSETSLLSEPRNRKLLLSAGFSWLFDAMDVGLVSFIAAALSVDWNLNAQQIGLLAAINSTGMAFGAAVSGSLADRYGRKAVLLWTLLLFSVASGLSALAPNLLVLSILRFVAGFGLGGELPVASTLVSESVPVNVRGKAIVLLESFWAGGWILAALISYFFIPHYGWRMALVIGALPAVYALFLRQAIEDSPRYKEQAERTRLGFRERMASIWSGRYQRATLTLWILWFTVVFSYYGMFLWLPTVMVMKGFTLVKSFQYVLIITLAQLPGYFTAAYLIEKIGRKAVLGVYLLMTAACAIWFGNAVTAGMLLTAGMFLSFFNLGAWGAMYAYTPEVYPTNVRSTGVGFAAAFGRIGGIIGPYLVGLLIDKGTSITSVFIVFFVAIVIGALTVMIFGRETKGIDPDRL